MPLSPISKLYGTDDAKIAKMTADPAGGTATYAASIDVPGIKSVTIEGDINVVELRGDHTLLDSDSVLNNITVTFEYAKLNTAVLAAVLGGSSADTGTTPNQVHTYSLLGTSSLFSNFKFEARVYAADTVGGDIHLVLYKCKLNEFPNMGTAEDDYQTFSVGASAVPRLADSKWMDIVYNETKVAIA